MLLSKHTIAARRSASSERTSTSRPESGRTPTATSRAEIDSYYEYLLKCSILFGDKECTRMWEDSISKVHSYLADEGTDMTAPNRTGSVKVGDLWYGHADMNTGKRTATTTGALDAFFPGLLALERRSESCTGVAGFDVQDVAGPRHRARGLQLQDREGRQRRLSAPARDRRIDVHSLPATPKTRNTSRWANRCWRISSNTAAMTSHTRD